MALGIMLSALVLSLVLVPALAALLGRSLWWPVRPRPAAVAHPRHAAAGAAREPERISAY